MSITFYNNRFKLKMAKKKLDYAALRVWRITELIIPWQKQNRSANFIYLPLFSCSLLAKSGISIKDKNRLFFAEKMSKI